MNHDTGALRAYIDGELDPEQQDALLQHLAGCARCRSELEALRTRAEAAALCLRKLPAAAPETSARAALARFHNSTVTQAAPTRWESLVRSFEMAKGSMTSTRWRAAAIALTAVLTLAVLFSIAPVRQAAADFLSLFRVRKFAVIPIDRAQIERLEGLADQAENVLGDPTVLREEGPEQSVADAAEASAVAGFTVRVPTSLPEGAVQEEFTVQAGPMLRFEVDRPVLEAVLQAAGVSPAGLPQTDKISATVDVGPGVELRYRFDGNAYGRSNLSLFQTPSPQVDVPEGMDIVALSETGFLLLGMPPEEARRLATTIDWSSTLVIPLPTDVGQAQEVTIDGANGLMIESTGRRGGGPGQDTLLLWERDGILYGVNGTNIDAAALLAAADSLQ